MDAYTFERTDLASRTLAARERAKVVEKLALEARVTLNLSNVKSISESFADELFGVLVLERGLEFVTRRLKIEGAQDNVLRSIAIAMKRRSSALQVA